MYGRRKKQKNFFVRHHQVFFFSVVFFIFVSAAVIWYKYVFLSDRFAIQHVILDPRVKNSYENPFLDQAIQELFLGKNKYLTAWFPGQKKQKLRDSFPLINDIILTNTSDGILTVSLTFHRPLLLFHQGTGFVGFLHDSFFRFSTGSELIVNIMPLHLPDYLQDFSLQKGLFYEIPPDMLAEQINLILSVFHEPLDLTFIPGGSRTVITARDQKKIIVNNKKNIQQQLTLFGLLQRHYKDYDKLTVIDLGSSDTIIVK